MNFNSVIQQLKSQKFLILISSFLLVLIIALGSYTLLANKSQTKPKTAATTTEKVSTSSSTPKVATTTPQPVAVNPPASTPKVTPKPTPTPAKTLPVLPYNYNVGDVFTLSPFIIKVTNATFNDSFTDVAGCIADALTGTSYLKVTFVYTYPIGTSENLQNGYRSFNGILSSGEQIGYFPLCTALYGNSGVDINSPNLNQSYIVYGVDPNTTSATVTFYSSSGSAIVKVK